GICIFSIKRLAISQIGLPFLLLALLTISVGSRVVIKFPRFRSHISIDDIFIYLAILLFDGEAAILLGAFSYYCSSFRVTKNPLIRLFNAGAMTSSTFLTVWVLRLGFGSLVNLSKSEYSWRFLVAMSTMASVQYVVNSGLIAIAGALRIKQP